MNSLEKKIAFSFGAISLAFMVMVIVTLIQVNSVTESSRRIQNILVPSIEANLRMTIAINTSLASLQSWMLIKDDKFVRQRQAIWSIIEKTHKRLINYSKNWEKTEQIEELKRIGQDLASFKQQQKTIEEAAYTKDDALAIQMLKEENIPMGQQLIAALRRISDPQKWEMKRTFAQEERQELILRNTALLFLFLSVVGGFSIAILLTRAVIMPLNRIIRLADSISKGDYSLNEKLSSGEEKLDIALRTMTTQLYEKEQKNKHQQKELKKNNKELELSNEELSQFSYRTSHDLKAPLITVRGLADAIREDIEDGDYQEAKTNAHNISGHVKRLEDLVVDILNLAKADLQITEKEKVNIEEVVCEIQERLKTIYIDNDVTIETDIDNSVEFYVSKVRLSQVLENLISNAIKYSDKNKSSRFVKISTMQKGKENLCVIEDNGLGIPDEFAERVFGMFQRFHPKISYGSGLGMYIIKKHIDKMDGEISFTSSENGTIFTIELLQST